MYLKSLRMIGFKSFADKTKLDFEPGMTSIVGPNGCGKSNIADAIRWVLGEQSARALRGGKMQDVIFNGTDAHRPMGMAEVSMTLTGCEAILGTEFHEVTITRRVTRSGEGQYFINRAPCRLKDVQRLFMDTGIGTNSYSLMEQGRIDQILSSRPDDRRAVFEEASGITKYKADKKEALRKLDHTEANLLRLDDIIREVRRQIISLQRQAGKARRYQTMKETLRGLDIYLTRQRLGEIEIQVHQHETSLASLREQEEAAREDSSEIEKTATKTREAIANTEQDINHAMEALSGSRSRLERASELIRINDDRIKELHALTERDSRDAENATNRLIQHKANLKLLTEEWFTSIRERDEANVEFNAHQSSLKELESLLEESGKSLHSLRTELVDLESRAAKLHNELADLEAQERTTVIRRERLSAEQAEFQHAAEQFAERQHGMNGRLNELNQKRTEKLEILDTLILKGKNLEQTTVIKRHELEKIRSTRAARKAQIDLLQESTAQAEGFPSGAKALLDGRGDLSLEPGIILGSLSEHIQAPETYQTALESVLRAWLDAVVVRDTDAAKHAIAAVHERSAGSVRLLPVESHSPLPEVPAGIQAPRLLERIQCSDDVRPLIQRLLGHVFVVDSIEDLPESVPPPTIFVTQDGLLRHGDGSAELWMPDANESNPLARQRALSKWKQEWSTLDRDVGSRGDHLDELDAEYKVLRQQIEAARQELQEACHEVAVCEGEIQVVGQDARQSIERLETVSFELNALSEHDSSVDNQRDETSKTLAQVRNRQDEARTTVAQNTENLRRMEQERSALYASVTEYRVLFAERRQHVSHLEDQKDSLDARIGELETLLEERTVGIDSYKARVSELTNARDQAKQSIDPLEREVVDFEALLEKARGTRHSRLNELNEFDARLHEKRSYLDSLMNQRSELEIELTQHRMRRQNQIERIASDYHLTIDDVMEHPEPVWENESPPDADTLDTMVGELRTKLDSMGPINLVAIDEHRELEERYAFLTQQQDDLVKGKQQLMEMIRQINKTTTEMFSATFDQVNKNFMEMFKRIFGGGTAKLVLVDEEEVLESGIEIIARPPGKKLQTVSLLSGGERTMTAVALLFSLYMVKPSAFCVLDELDAALDEANIGRFIEVVKGFLDRSQFVLITHNRKTIAASDTLYGVTMQDRGISNVVSVKFSEYEEAGGKIPSSNKMRTPQPIS